MLYFILQIHIHSSPEYLKDHFSLDMLPESLGGTLVTESYVKVARNIILVNSKFLV